MIKLHDLKSAPGARVGRKRKGRGIGSGLYRKGD
jgi:ribosomal protein L15